MKHSAVFTFVAAAAFAGAVFGAEPAKPIEVVAVYYPHWHQYPKGDEWFGPSWKEGEWTFAKTMKKRFPGHKTYKPLPGYLDGKNPVDVETEIALASGNGIDVFLYDYYWYNGQKTQEEAIEQGFLKAKNRGRMKFALMWCYHERLNQFRPENKNGRVPLMSLAHTPEEFLGLIDYAIAHYFNQPEYWRKDGKLFFSIYNVRDLYAKWGRDVAKVKGTFDEARRRVRAAGLGELHLNGQNVRPNELDEFAALGLDSFTDYGFNTWRAPNYQTRWQAGERLFGYEEIDGVLQAHWAEMRKGPLPYIPIVPTGWDATARCRNDEPFPWKAGSSYPYCGTFTNCVTSLFEKYLRDAKAAAEADPKKPGAVYINAWNEYTEGCHLLPSVREGDLKLRCVGRVFGRRPADKLTTCSMKHWWDPKAKNGTAFTVDAPTFENLRYGPHDRQSMDVWLPENSSGAQTPVLINIHGGGWSDGDRLGGVNSTWPNCRKAGVALVSISYRMVHDANDAGIKPPVKACLDDAVAAIEFVKAHAAEWRIDVGRIGLTGGSAGACSSLYASLQDDCALGIRAVLVHSPQTSIDPKEMKEWIPNSNYGSHAFGYPSFTSWLDHRADCLAQIEAYSPAGLLRKCTAYRAPVFLYTCGALPKAGELPKDPTHAAMFCVKFEEICRAKGIDCRRGSFDDLMKALKAEDAGARLYVDAQKGSDANPGTAEKPFATPLKARDALRALPSRDGAVVELTGHFDTIGPSILKLGKEDGAASSTRPVVWRAGKDGAFFSGACRIGAKDFVPVTGAALARLKPEARGKVVQCDLAKFGVGELKPLPAKFNRWSEMELVSSGKAMTIARCPNTGWLEITNVIDRGVAPCDRTKDEWEFGVRGGTFEYAGAAPERWDVKTGVYLFGFWCYDWSSDTLRVAKIDKEKKTITMEGVHTYGLGKPGKWCQAKVRYFAYNMLEELDAPGEWYVDRPTRTLYFYPTEAGLADVSLSVAKDSLVTIEETKNIVLQGIDFKYSTGKAVGMGKCENVVLDGLTVSWLSQDAVSVWEGHDCVVRNCRISEIGSTGLSVYAGDRKSLTKCNHVVRGNDIGSCGRLARISGPCIRFGGCGILVERNYFHDTPYLTVGYGGNEHLFQYNEIECSMLEAGDGGGMYTGRDWGSRGNVVRWNYLHHFGKEGVALREAQGRPSGCEALKKDVMVEGIYLDDCDSGELIYGNLFYKAGRAMFTGGGRDNTWLHNLVIDCTTAVHFDTRGLQRAKPGSGLKNGWDLLAKIEACGYTNEPWASRYPQLIGVMDKEPLLPIGTEYVSNVAVRCGFFYNSYGHATKFLQERAPNRANVSYNPKDAVRENRDYPQTNALLRAKLEIRTDDAFAAQAEADPVGFQDSSAFRAAFPSFPRIPVERIGLKGVR